MTREWKILVSYIDDLTQSIFFQQLSDPLYFHKCDFFVDIENGFEIELEPDEWACIPDWLSASEKKNVNGATSSVRLRKVSIEYQNSEFPSGGELFSLLQGTKKLAAFSMKEGDDKNIVLDGQEFSKFISQGLINERVLDLRSDEHSIIYLLYFLPGNAWRADIYENLKRHLAIASWTEYLDQIESMLLGYCVKL